MHLCIGQEGVAGSLFRDVEDERQVGQRGKFKCDVAELYGRATGCCGGRSGMHLIDLTNHGFDVSGGEPVMDALSRGCLPTLNFAEQ